MENIRPEQQQANSNKKYFTLDTVKNKIERENVNFDTAIVVLGGGGKERLIAGLVDYYKLKNTGKKPLLILSGWGGAAKPEAELMFDQIKDEESVEALPILISRDFFDAVVEPKSIDTAENAKFSSKIIKSLGIENVHVVSHNYHLDKKAQTDFKKYLPKTKEGEKMYFNMVSVENIFDPNNKENIWVLKKLFDKNFLEQVKKEVLNMPYNERVRRAESYNEFTYKDPETGKLTASRGPAGAMSQLPFGNRILTWIAKKQRTINNKQSNNN